MSQREKVNNQTGSCLVSEDKIKQVFHTLNGKVLNSEHDEGAALRVEQRTQ